MSEPAGTELCHGQSRSQSQPAPDLQVKCDDNSRSKLIVHFLTQMEIDQFLKNINSDCDIFYNFSRFLLFLVPVTPSPIWMGIPTLSLGKQNSDWKMQIMDTSVTHRKIPGDKSWVMQKPFRIYS